MVEIMGEEMGLAAWQIIQTAPPEIQVLGWLFVLQNSRRSEPEAGVDG